MAFWRISRASTPPRHGLVGDGGCDRRAAGDGGSRLLEHPRASAPLPGGARATTSRAGRAQVIVVDNGSRDGSAAAAREHAPWARRDEARGQSRLRCRRQLVAARTTANGWRPPTPISRSPRGRSSGCSRPPPTRAWGGGAQAGAPGRQIQHSVGPLPTLPLALSFAFGSTIRAWLGDRLCLPDCWDPERARVVPWAVGACLILRRAAFDAVGGFDERQWMYAEDLDLGWRLHDAGWLTRYEPGAG